MGKYFVVLGDTGSSVAEKVNKLDNYQFSENVYGIRSDLISAEEVKEELGVSISNSAVVFPMANAQGFADTEFINWYNKG